MLLGAYWKTWTEQLEVMKVDFKIHDHGFRNIKDLVFDI